MTIIAILNHFAVGVGERGEIFVLGCLHHRQIRIDHRFHEGLVFIFISTAIAFGANHLGDGSGHRCGRTRIFLPFLQLGFRLEIGLQSSLS